jgi:hypothetical protein
MIRGECRKSYKATTRKRKEKINFVMGLSETRSIPVPPRKWTIGTEKNV